MLIGAPGAQHRTLAMLLFLLLLISTQTNAEDPQGLTLYGRVHGGLPIESGAGIPGERIDLRKGTLDWEVLDISLPGNGGLDIEVYRKFMSNVRAERTMEDWDISLPRITMNTNPTGTTKFETYGVDTTNNPGICADDNFNANINYQNYNLAFAFGGMVDYFNLDEDSPFITGIVLNLIILAISTDVPVADTYTGLQLTIPGEGTKNLLRNINQQLMSEHLQRFAEGKAVTARYVTPDNWLVDCAPDSSGKLNNFIVYSPDGKTYTLDKRSKAMGDPMFLQQTGQNVWYPSKVEDTHGNSINYKYITESYLCLGWQEYLLWYTGHLELSPRLAPVCPNTFKIKEISSSDGRKITFNYERPSEGILRADRTLHNHSGRRIASIEAHGRVWKYRYGEWHPGFSNYLREVELPDGTMWQFEKFETNNGGIPFMSNDWARNFQYSRWTGALSFEPDSMVAYLSDGTKSGPGVLNTAIGLMKSVTTPLELKIEYTYKTYNANFFEDTTSTLNKVYSVQTRSISGPDVLPVSRSYSYTKNGSLNLGYTEITYPSSSDGAIPLKRYTFDLKKGADHFGLPVLEEIYSNDLLVQEKSIEYETLATIDLPSRINESPRSNNVLRAQKQITITNQDGNQYITTFDEFDAYGRPNLVTESGSPFVSYIDSDIGRSMQPTRVREISYFNNYDDWIIGKQKDITLINNGGGSGDLPVNREYFSNGLMKSITKNGNTQTFTYHTNGNLKSKSWTVSGKRYTATYSDYYRGIARIETQPHSIQIKREVNDWGEITEFTNGKKISVSFVRDELGRVESVNHPDFSGKSTEWNFNGNPRLKRTTEGNIQIDTKLNALGKGISTVTTDLVTGETTYQDKEYDSFSQLIFESNRSFLSNPVVGIRYQYDVMGRKVYSEDQRNNIIRTCYSVTCLPVGAPYSGWDLSGNILQVETIELPAGGDESGSLAQDVENFTVSAAYGDPSDAFVVGVFVKEKESLELDRYSATLYSRTLSGDPVRISKGAGTIASRASRTYQYYANTNLIRFDVNPDLGTTEFFYDESENVRRKIINSEVDISYKYDFGNRLLYENYPNTNGTPDISYNYDRNGNIKWIDNGYARLVYEYNTADLLESVTYYISGNAYVVDYEWNFDRTLSALIYPDNERVDYNPNGYGLPTTVGAYAQAAMYHPTNHLKSFDYGNGVSYQSQLNDYNMPSEYEIRTSTNALLAREIYQHNFRKQIYEVNKRIGVGASSILESYQYTPSNYLRSGFNELGPVSYEYDSLGNLKSKQENGQVVNMTFSGAQSGSLGTRISTASSDSDANYSFSYDSLGNVVGNGRNSFLFDNASRLSEVTDLGIKYFYDGRGHRIVESYPDATKITLRGDQGQVIYQYNLNQNKVFKYYGLGSVLVAESEVECVVNCNSMLDMQPRTVDADRSFESADLYIKRNNLELLDSLLHAHFEVGNNGQDSASNVEVYLSLPSGSLRAFTVSKGACEQEERELNCLIGNLEPGESVELTIEASNLTIEQYEKSSVSKVSSYTFDPNLSNNEVVAVTKSGGSCPSETAAEGTMIEDQLGVIREYRDEVLANSFFGSEIITAYYNSAPYWLDMMKRNDWSLYLMRVNVTMMLLISYIGLSPLEMCSLFALMLLVFGFRSKLSIMFLRKDA